MAAVAGIGAVALAGCSDEQPTTASAPSVDPSPDDLTTSTHPDPEPTTSDLPPQTQPESEPTPTTEPEPTPTTQPEPEPTTTTQPEPELEPTTEPAPTTTTQPEPESGTTDDSRRPVPSLLAGAHQRAPEWPFRGMVWAFSQDVDGDGWTDVVVHYHDTSERSFTELVISGFDSGDALCSTGMLVTEGGLGLISPVAAEPLLVIPWGESPTQDQDTIGEVLSPKDLADFRRQTMSLGLVQASVVSNSGSRWLTMTGAGTEYAHHFGFPHSSPDGYVYPAYLRGSDGEFLAVAFTEPGDNGLCDRQHTYVISMKTGEVVACGYHDGHLEFITPPGAGLLVEHIVMPSAGFFTPESCKLSLQESALWPAPPTELADDSLAGYLSDLPEPSEVKPDQPDGPEEPPEDEPAEQAEPAPAPEVVVSGSPAPEWPFRGLVAVDFIWGEGKRPSTHTIRYLSSRDRTVTEMVVEGLESVACGRASIGRISEAGVTVEALWDPREGSGGFVTLVIPWGETPRVVAQDPYTEGDSSWQDLLTSAYHVAHGYVHGGTAFDVSIHANGLRLRAGEAAENYQYEQYEQYETWGSRHFDDGDSPPPESIELHGDHLSTLDYVYFLGTDGEFVGFATYPWEPNCAPATGYLISMRTGDAFACGFAADAIALVQPPQEGLLVEEVALPNNRQLREECGDGDLAKRWASLPQAPVPYPLKPGPAPPPLPTATAPSWPFRGAVLALQRYVPHLFSYETVLQYRSSEDGSVTELVFGPMRRRSPDLVVEADEHGVEVWRRDWAVRVPWGDAAEMVDIESATVEPARTTAYPTLIAFGRGETLIEIESFITQEQISRLTVGPHWAGGQRSWYVWSAPNESMINTPLEISSQHSVWPVWLRGTDGRVMAIGRQENSEICEYSCNPVLTVLISLETGQVLSCGVELNGADALIFVAPAGSSVTPNAKLPPSGWLDPDACASQETDDASDCSWLWHYSREEPRCGRLFGLAEPPDATAATVVPAFIQADLEQLKLLIQPAVGG